MSHGGASRILVMFFFAAVFTAADWSGGVCALDLRIPFFSKANLPDNADAEVDAEKRISEVLDQNVAYRELFAEIANPDVFLRRHVRVGEELHYQAKWRGLPAGSVRMAAKRLSVIKGRPVFVFELNAESNDFMNTFYPVSTSANSYVDAVNGRSYLLRRRISERNRNYKDRLEFKYDFRLPSGLPDPVLNYSEVSESGNETASRPIPIPGNMQDMVSVCYYLRGMDLRRPGDSVAFLVGGRHQPGIMTLTVVAEERIQVSGLGAFDCLVVEPRGDGTNISGVMIASRGAERIWLEKNTRIPIQFAAELPSPLGPILATLMRAENCPLAEYAVK